MQQSNVRPSRDPSADEGATSTEYLFLMVFIALVILAGVQVYGLALGDAFSGAASDVADSVGSG